VYKIVGLYFLAGRKPHQPEPYRLSFFKKIGVLIFELQKCGKINWQQPGFSHLPNLLKRLTDL